MRWTWQDSCSFNSWYLITNKIFDWSRCNSYSESLVEKCAEVNTILKKIGDPARVKVVKQKTLKKQLLLDRYCEMVHELYDKPEKGITASAFDFIYLFIYLFICFFPVWLHFPSHVLYFNFKASTKKLRAEKCVG